jgi:hypothetical protein
MSSYRPEVTWRRGDGEMITVKTAGKKIKSKYFKYCKKVIGISAFLNDFKVLFFYVKLQGTAPLLLH